MRRILYPAFSFRLGVWAVLASSFVASPTFALEEPEERPLLHTHPLISVVIPIDWIDRSLTWSDILFAAMSGEAVFDDIVRRPGTPEQPIPVDCTRTREIGVAFRVTSAREKPVKVRKFRFSWFHEGIDRPQPIVSGFKGAQVDRRMPRRLLLFGTMYLNSMRRVDGEWTVKVFHLGEQIYQESFLLHSCDGQYIPREFANDGLPGIPVAARNAAAPFPDLPEAAPEPPGQTPVVEKAPTPPPEPVIVVTPTSADAERLIAMLDTELNRYLQSSLPDAGLDADDLPFLLERLKVQATDERSNSPKIFDNVPERLHLVDVKLRFLRSVNQEFQNGNLPAPVSSLIGQLSALEKTPERTSEDAVPRSD